MVDLSVFFKLLWVLNACADVLSAVYLTKLVVKSLRWMSLGYFFCELHSVLVFVITFGQNICLGVKFMHL